jgi:hypothetical protein
MARKWKKMGAVKCEAHTSDNQILLEIPGEETTKEF